MKKQKKRGIPLDRSERTILVIAYLVMGIFTLMALLPCLHVVSKAFSDGVSVTSGQVYFWPKGFQLEALTFILEKTGFLTALKNSLIITVVGTCISLLVTITTAYPLSKPAFRGRKLITFLYVFSMVFYGGIVPAYMVINTLGIMDTYWACILPFAIVQFNMFVMKNYFESLPEEIEESAHMDGAGDIRTLFMIVCPMSKPVIATVGLLYAVTYWNDYFHAMMFTRSDSMKTLQVFLHDIIYSGSEIAVNLASGENITNLTSQSLVAATVTLSLIPIIAVYPFVQRYLVKGLTIGSVKG